MLTERFIIVLNVFKGFSYPVYVAPWTMLGTESNSLVVIVEQTCPCWSHSGWGFLTGAK
jgi:hypothetical protein